jgi:hypothetical protein
MKSSMQRNKSFVFLRNPFLKKINILLSFLLFISLSSSAQVSKNYQHWSDVVPGQWQGDILSAQKSDYFEGEVIPHVLVIQATNQKPLTNGQSYTFDIIYNYYQSNNNAGGFAFITRYDISRQSLPAIPGGPGVPASDNTYANGSTDGNIGVQPGTAFFTKFADITAVSAPVTSGSTSKDRTVTVTFDYTGPTTKSGMLAVYYGLFIATPGAVANQGSGTTVGAHAWSGGSLQTTVNSNFNGALSVQLAPSAIIVGSISGLKFKDLDNDGSARETGEPVLSGWKIYIDLDNDQAWDDVDNDGVMDPGDEPMTTTASDGTYSFAITPDANKNTGDNDPYIIREVLQSGWTQTYPGVAGSPASASNPYAYTFTITAIAPTQTGNFGNFICVNPTITTPAIGSVCKDATTASLSYGSVTGDANQYRIDWNAAAETAGLTDIAYTTLPASPFNITIPGTLAAATYTGTIYVKNSTTGCASAGDAISLTINANPTASGGTAPAAQCLNAADGNTFNLDGDGANGTPLWAVQSKSSNALTVDITNGNTFDPTVKVSGGYGTVTLRLTVTSNASPSCGTPSSDVTVTVTNKPSTPSACFILPSLCFNAITPTGTVVFDDLTGYQYSIKDGASDSWQTCRVFPGLAPGAVTGLKVKSGDGCVSDAADCSQIPICTSVAPTCPQAGARMRTDNYSMEQQIVVEEPTKVTAYPNPFSNKVKFVVTSALSGKGSLEVYNMLGQKIKSVYQGQIIVGNQTFELSLPSTARSNLIYVLRVGDKRVTGKLLHINR